MKAPEQIETQRLLLRKPCSADARAIFERYASDAEVTRLLSFPRHRSLDDTRAVLAFSESEWQRWPAGPYLIESREDGRLLGGTGFGFETPFQAEVGYVLAKDAWGRGYATEALGAVVRIGRELGVARLQALCHIEHQRSRRVLEKCGFVMEGILRRHSTFPNLDARRSYDVACYALIEEDREDC
jgi:ribosomal-protein-alanine N-acetyltransferase